MDLLELQKQILDNTYTFIRESIQDANFERSELKTILKEELTELGHWKNLPRGKPRSFKE